MTFDPIEHEGRRKVGKKFQVKYLLHLYFAGQSPRTKLAITNLSDICNRRLGRRCNIKLIDILHNPSLAKMEQIVAVPTLVKKSPLPERRVIGDLSDWTRVVLGLDLK